MQNQNEIDIAIKLISHIALKGLDMNDLCEVEIHIKWK